MLTVESGGGEPDWRARSKRLVLSLLGLELVVLVVTGIGLYFAYRPSATGSFDVNGEAPGLGVAGWLRLLHRLATVLAVPTALLAGALLAFLREGPRRWGGWLLGVGIVVTTLAASFTGYLLPWDQLALWAVTVGTNIDGYEFLGDRVVRFVLLGGAEISTGTLARWLVIHALVLGPALVLLTAAAWRRSRRAGPETPPV